MSDTEIVKRIEQLEKSNRHWRTTCVLLVVSGLVLFAAREVTAKQDSSGVMNSLKVRELQLVDATGKTRATLGTKANGAASLAFRKTNGKIATFIGVFDSGSGLLAFDDAQGHNALVLGYEASAKFPFVQMHKNGMNGADLSLDEKGNGSLILRDSQGKDSYSAP